MLFTVVARKRPVWLWTVYGSHSGGMEASLEEAQAKFKMATAAWP